MPGINNVKVDGTEIVHGFEGLQTNIRVYANVTQQRRSS